MDLVFSSGLIIYSSDLYYGEKQIPYKARLNSSPDPLLRHEITVKGKEPHVHHSQPESDALTISEETSSAG